ncbi:hypothetical protein [Pseudoalteromonas luteoviolacea]|nr:hypothetical protein [Pseudoalteromonas luteoviolacea]
MKVNIVLLHEFSDIRIDVVIRPSPFYFDSVNTDEDILLAVIDSC